MKTITNKLKVALVAIGFLTIGAVSAQTTTTTDALLNKSATATDLVKLIDNKGTIKYLQSKNGITQITSTSAGNRTTTTWQLGGTLTDDTTITLNDGTTDNKFTIDGINFNLENIATTSAIAATTTTAASGTETGFTLLVRNEATGNVEKLLATDLVSGIRHEHTQGLDATADVDITVTGLPTLSALTTAAKLFVYRNGAKLRFGTDFTVTADTVTIEYDATDLPMYAGDIVEIQYIK